MNSNIQEPSNETNVEQELSTTKSINIPLEQILPRVNGDLRPINQEHVENIKTAIKAKGFTSTILVDSRYHLIGGGHRLEALVQLKNEGWNGKSTNGSYLSFDAILCVVHKNDSSMDKDEAFILELAENVVRKDLTSEEIDKAIEIFYSRGFRHSSKRQKDGEPSITMMLREAFNMSAPTAFRRYKEWEIKTGKGGGVTIQGATLWDETDKSVIEAPKKGRPPMAVKTIVNRFVIEANEEEGVPSPCLEISEPEPVPECEPIVEPQLPEPITQLPPPSVQPKDPLVNLVVSLVDKLNRFEMDALRNKGNASDLGQSIIPPKFQLVREIIHGWMAHDAVASLSPNHQMEEIVKICE